MRRSIKEAGVISAGDTNDGGEGVAIPILQRGNDHSAVRNRPVLKYWLPPVNWYGGLGLGEPHRLVEKRSDMGPISSDGGSCRHREAAVKPVSVTEKTVQGRMIKSEAASKRAGRYGESLLQEARSFPRELLGVRVTVQKGERSESRESRRANIRRLQGRGRQEPWWGRGIEVHDTATARDSD